MATPLQRLYRTKLLLLAVVFTVIGLVLVLAAKVIPYTVDWLWLAQLPLSELGSALFTTGLIVVGFEYVDRQDAEERALERLRQVLTEQAPMLRDTVIQGFAVEPETLAKVASPETLDQVVNNALAVQLGDRDLAHEVYADLRSQVLRTAERWRDVSVKIDLAPTPDGPASGHGSMFVATIRWEYRVVPLTPVMRFACVSDLTEYRELLDDPTSTLVWYFEPVAGLDAASEEVFELTDFSLDGGSVPIRRHRRSKGQTYLVDVTKALKDQFGVSSEGGSGEVVIAYTYRARVQRNSHVLQIDLAKPSRGFSVRLSYSGCGIRHINVLDYFARPAKPRVSQIGAPSPSVEVSQDGWVWPKSGVAFAWVLEDELGLKAK